MIARFLYASVAAFLILAHSEAQISACSTNYCKQAWEESATPIRPGVPGESPFWNIRAKRFIYAPAFNYAIVDKAVKYRYTILSSNLPKPLSFESAVPYSSLSEVWKDVPVGSIMLKVEGIDKLGEIIGTSGEGEYYRAAPFAGVYHNAVLPYGKSAAIALDTLYARPYVTSWLDTKQPDWNYLNYRYPAKIFSALVVGAIVQAKLNSGTEKAKESTNLARTIADYLLSIRFRPGSPWEYFVPTYYGPKIANAKRGHINLNNMFTLMGVDAGRAFLDIYDYTKDQKYFDAALKIADTYVKNQLPNGSWYQFVYHETGKPFFDNILIPTAVVNFFDRLKHDYRINKYESAREKAFQWTMNNPVKTFDWQGQFEDVKGQKPYMNLSREQACELAMYLFKNKTNLALAKDLVRFAEDQFVIWEKPLPTPDAKPNTSRNSDTWITPSVQEQYVYFMPVGRTAGIMLDTYINAYRATRKDAYLAKAVSIANAFTVVQKFHDGHYATYFSTSKLDDWLNSTVYPAKIMMEFDQFLKNDKSKL